MCHRTIQSPGVIAAEMHRAQTPIMISRSNVQSPCVIVAEKHRRKTAIIMFSNVIQSPAVTGSHSVLVSVSDYRLEGLGFKSH